MSRAVAVVDADTNLLTELSRELTAAGLVPETFTDANELLARADRAPDLVILCIDPKRTGWAVCNRLRKSPVLKSVPLVITSAEATEKDFEDHRKLKTRAEDYVQKPMNVPELVRRVALLLGYDMPGESGDSDSDGDAIVIEEDVVIEDESNGLLDLDSESTRIGMRFDEVAAENERGFAQDELTNKGVSRDQVAAMFAAEQKTNVPANVTPSKAAAPVAAAAPAPAPKHDPGSFATSPNPVSGVFKVPEAPTSGLAAELGLDAVARQASEEPVRQRRASSPYPVGGSHAAVDTAKFEAQIAELQRERDRLASELDSAKRARPDSTAPTGGLSREREFLTLRETINKKEKETLDLRDALDARDRQILDGNQKLRDAERKARDLDDKLLAGERESMAERERAEELAANVRQLQEREQQARQKIEEAQRNTQAQLDAAQRSHAQALAARDSEHQNAHAATQQKAAEELAQWKAQAQNEAAAAEARRLGEIASLEGRRARELALADERRLSELTAAEEQRAKELGEIDKRHQLEAATATERHRGELAATEQRVREELALERSQELAVAETRRNQELAGLEKSRVSELEAAITRTRTELEAKAAERETALNAELANAMQAIEQFQAGAETMRAEHEKNLAAAITKTQADAAATHKAELEKLAAQHQTKLAEERVNFETQVALAAQSATQTLDALNSQHAADRSAKAAEHAEEVEAVQSQLELTQTQLQNARDASIAQSGKITELEGRVSDLTVRETELNKRVAELDKMADRVLADAQAAERARRALAVAVALLDQIAPEDEKSG